MKLFNVTFLLYNTLNECYVVAEDYLKAEALVISTHKKKYGAVLITVKQIDCIADTNSTSPLTDLILEERSKT